MYFNLIQRGSFRDNVTKISSIDDVIRFDYMGSAEFEFGALPKSLRRIVADYENYQFIPTSIVNHASDKLVLFCKYPDSVKIEDFLLSECEGKYNKLKEDTQLNHWYTGGRFSQNSPNFWWDIQNDWFAMPKSKTKNFEMGMQALKQNWG